MQDIPDKLQSLSILGGVDYLIDSALHLTGDPALDRDPIGRAPHHQHITSCQRRSTGPLDGFDALALVTAIYEKVVVNWRASSYHNGSDENWRLKSNPDIAENNNSEEVFLERAIVRIMNLLQPEPECWFNQVPVASGLVHPTADHGRNIDLVHRLGDKAFELIELKVRSDTPLFAAMEILKYGLVYVFCRHCDLISQSIFKHRRLLEAERIHLRVLAPAAYYKMYDLSWLESSLNEGLAEFSVQRGLPFGLDFAFEILTLVARSPVNWRSSRP
jgi:hypothetical protein